MYLLDSYVPKLYEGKNHEKEWEKFKTEFDQDMLELVNALNNFSLKNNK